jgi:hypothetical protein
MLLMTRSAELRANTEGGVRQHFVPPLSIESVGVPIVAAGLIAELGMPRPGFGVPQIATLAGVAPIEAFQRKRRTSSSEPTREPPSQHAPLFDRSRPAA